eukprot:364308-Chlamydomonas_euryale.AAC.2
MFNPWLLDEPARVPRGCRCRVLPALLALSPSRESRFRMGRQSCRCRIAPHGSVHTSTRPHVHTSTHRMPSPFFSHTR